MEYPGSNPEDHDINNKLICVEYPGVVKNENAMLKTLGGLRAVSTIFSATTKDRLEINFRPDNIYSKPIYGTKCTTSGILVKVRVRKPKTSTSKPTQPAVDDVQIVGVVDRVYRFENLCDFQYLPIKKVGGKTKYIYDDIVPQGILKSDWLENDKDVPLFLPPQIFSRVDTVQKQLFKRDTPNTADNPATVSTISVNRQRRINHAQYVEFNLHAQLPTAANALTYEILKIKLVKKEHFDLIKELFERRPIWTRLALLHECKLKNVVVKHILPAIAYYFTTGPWRVCWVRLGYDPRFTFEARYFQTLDYRIRSGGLKHDTKPKQVFNHLRHSNRAKDEIDSNNSLENQNYWPIFDATTIPCYRIMFYQFCDIHLPKIQEMLDRLIPSDAICNEKRGWLPIGFDDQCRDILTEIVKENYQNVFKKNLTDEQENYGEQQQEDEEENENEENVSDEENEEDDDYELGDQIEGMDIDE